MVTVKDISIACGVTQSTVSKALNHYEDVSKETAQRVIETAKRLGYQPNAAARQLRTKKSYSIGILLSKVVVGGIGHEYYSKILNSMKDEAERLGYDISFISRNVGKEQMSYLNYCRYKSLDGYVIACVDLYDPEILELLRYDIPKVAIDYTLDDCTAVISDNLQGMSSLVEYVYSQGHRRIAYIHGEPSPVTQKRIATFYRTCESFGITVPDAYVRSGLHHNTEASYAITKELLALDEPPTCILYPDDYSYVGGGDAIAEAGMKVPQDISAAGYDGISLSQLLRPRLTTVLQDTEQLGTLAVRKLVEAIENPKTEFPEQIIVPTRLIIGGSVGKMDA